MEETMNPPAARAAKLPLILLGAALLLALATALYFYFNWRGTEDQLISAKSLNTELERDSYRVSNLIQKNKGDREILSNLAYKSIVLRGTAKSPGSLALAYYDPNSHKLLLDVRRMPEAPVGQQYQLWAMNGTKATDAGTIRPEKMNEGLLEMNPINGAQSLVLTLEKAGGAAAPTLSATCLTAAL